MTSTFASEIAPLLAAAFPEPCDAISFRAARQGRGVFSRVLRVGLRWPVAGAGQPPSVVVKLPADGSNGQVARATGAYEREAEAYLHLLPGSPVRYPHPYLVERDGAGSASFVLEDLTDHRVADQLDGLGADDCLRIGAELRRFHDWWRGRVRELDALGVRRSVPASFDPLALAAGLDALATRWRGELDDRQLAAYRAMVDRREQLIDAFGSAGPPTLCHGDPRADNIRFDPAGRPILFDWQQIAVQPGAADLAWLAATSLTPGARRQLDQPLIEHYATTSNAYRCGFILPGLAVLLLAQRVVDQPRAAQFVVASLQRIGTALVDLEIADIGSD
jgi:hypothetical protein